MSGQNVSGCIHVIILQWLKTYFIKNEAIMNVNEALTFVKSNPHFVINSRTSPL